MSQCSLYRHSKASSASLGSSTDSKWLTQKWLTQKWLTQKWLTQSSCSLRVRMNRSATPLPRGGLEDARGAVGRTASGQSVDRSGRISRQVERPGSVDRPGAG